MWLRLEQVDDLLTEASMPGGGGGGGGGGEDADPDLEEVALQKGQLTLRTV